ncbi:unnamed protein product [Closterium sp. NIES-54]
MRPACRDLTQRRSSWRSIPTGTNLQRSSLWRKKKNFASGALRSRAERLPGVDGRKKRVPPMKGGKVALADGVRAILTDGAPLLPHRDPWDTIDWGYEPSTPQHTVYGPDLELREPTFVPGTIPGTNILYSIILDRDFLALMLTTGNDEEEEGEEAAAEADEDPEAAHTRYKRTSGLRATDGLWHQRLGHPSRVTQKNCIEAGVFAPGALLRPDGSEVRSTIQPRNGTVCPEVGTNRYPKLHKVYRDFLNVGHCGIDDELYTLTFVEVRTCYVWIVNVEARSSAYDVFRLWLAHAQQ